MEPIDTELAERIRKDIILGNYKEGERLSEAQLCDTYKVSRTPVRLALRLLDREGIIRRCEGRGYLVQSPTVEDILQAVVVRGHLESLAARLMAQNQSRFVHLPQMARAIEKQNEANDELARIGRLDDETARRSQSWNMEFHSTILKNCGNAYVSYSCQQISHLPMLAVGSMVFEKSFDGTPEQFERGIFGLRIAIAQHRIIYDAIEKGDPVRAENMMREHTHTIVDYIQKLIRRGGRLTIADLIAYSAG
jgi:GntR family transcriptional regulator of vanillate catabolism